MQEYEAQMKDMKKELMTVKASKGEVEQEVNKLRSHYETQLAALEQSSLQSKNAAEQIYSTCCNCRIVLENACLILSTVWPDVAFSELP